MCHALLACGEPARAAWMGEAPVPPWRLLSPTCVVYTVRDQPALVALAGDAGVKPSNFKQLVGLQANSSVGLPQHKAGWQLLERVWWIARSSWCGLPPVAPLPLASADGRKWVELFYDIHGDAHLDGARLRTLAHKGTHSQRMFVHDGARHIPSNPSPLSPPVTTALTRGMCVSPVQHGGRCAGGCAARCRSAAIRYASAPFLLRVKV